MKIFQIIIEKVFLNKHRCRSYDIVWRPVIFPLNLEYCYLYCNISLLQEAGRIQKCLHWHFPIAILPPVRTGFIVFPKPFILIILQHLNRFVVLFPKSNLIEFWENRFMKSLTAFIRLRWFFFRFCMIYVLQVKIKFNFMMFTIAVIFRSSASKTFKCFWKGSRSWRYQINWMPPGEIHPSLRNSLETLCSQGRIVQHNFYDSGFDFRINSILRIRSVQVDYITRCKLTISLIKLFETVKTVSGIAKGFTCLSYATKLATQYKKSQFLFNDFASKFFIRQL